MDRMDHVKGKKKLRRDPHKIVGLLVLALEGMLRTERAVVAFLCLALR